VPAAVRAGTAVPGTGWRGRGPGREGRGAPDGRAAGRRRAPGQQGQPITRDALRARLGVFNQAASELLRQLRAGEGQPPTTFRAA
jgi:hypothetical protein